MSATKLNAKKKELEKSSGPARGEKRHDLQPLFGFNCENKHKREFETVWEIGTSEWDQKLFFS
jgi:hypothetical protein